MGESKWKYHNVGARWLELPDGYNVIFGTTYCDKLSETDSFKLISLSITRRKNEKDFCANKREGKDIKIEGDESVYIEHKDKIMKAKGLKEDYKKSLEFIISQIDSHI